MYLRNRLKTRLQLLRLLPIGVPFLLIFLYGIVYAILQSFGFITPVPSDFKVLDSYKVLVSDPWFIKSCLYSLKIAFISAIISLFVGSVMAYWLWNLDDKKYTIVYKIPIILPHIVAAFFIQIFFSRSGLLSTILYNIGIIKTITDFPLLVYSDSGIGIIMAYIYKEVPFVILFKLAIYNRIEIKIITAAENLGAGKLYTFFKVILPYLIPVMNTLFIILFLYSLGAFEIPFLVGASRPEMLPVYVYKLYFEKSLSYRPVAMAALVLIFLFSSVFVFCYSHISKKILNGARRL